MLSAQNEARKILALYNQNIAPAITLLEGQLNVLYTRAQVLVSLSGIVITVTGFSGRIIANTDEWAKFFIISGLYTVILSALWVYITVMRIRWVTSLLEDDPEVTVITILEWRNRKTKAYRCGGAILFVGLILYATAVALMLANPEPLQILAR
jgi:hypothetical protein